ncbi:MAG: hypothetical protein WCK09_16935 [Bacteroidota bacterium]
MKKKILFLSMTVFLSLPGMLPISSFGQGNRDEVNITVATVSGLIPGNTINLSVDMFTDPANNIFTEPGYINVYYDPDILTPIEPFAANNPPGVSISCDSINSQNGIYHAVQIYLNYSAYTGSYKLCDLVFQYNGGNSEVFIDPDSCSLTDLNGECTVLPTNGKVSGSFLQVASLDAGNWNVPATWNHAKVPNRSGDVIIASMPVTVSSGTNARCHNLIINPSGGLTLNSGSKVGLLGSVVINSDATGTGSLLDYGSLTIDSVTTVKRYLTGYSGSTDKKHHFISSPVSSQPIQPGFVQNPPASNVDFSKNDEISGTWISAKTPAGAWNSSFENDFSVGKGYLVAYPANGTNEFAGSLNNGSYTLHCTNTTAPGGAGWNLLGNPYPSSLNWNAVTKTGMDNALYYYDASIQNYRYYIQLPGDTAGIGSGIPYIPAMQGFMVHAKTGGGNITINNSMRVHPSTGTFYKSGQDGATLLKMSISAGNSAPGDDAYIVFRNGPTENFDGDYEAMKLYSFNPNVPVLHTLSSDSVELAINALPYTNEPVVVPMHFEVVTDTTYTLTISGMESFSSETLISLEDLKTQQTFDVRLNPEHRFTGSHTDNPERFHIHFSGPIGIQDHSSASQVSIYAYNRTIYIGGLFENEKEVSIWSMIGQQILHQSFNKQGLISIPMTGRSGYYIVKVVSRSGCSTEKVFLK